jgi:ADP-heptose:LPS heptosyltransferase
MALRDMPQDVHRSLLESLGAIIPVVTQGASCAGAVSIGELDDLASLCGLVANAEAIISTDTAMVHLADAFGVKTLAVFTTHRPDWRVRDYPLCRALHLPVDGLPDSLEFSRGDADLRAAKAAWRDNAARITDAASNLLAS